MKQFFVCSQADDSAREKNITKGDDEEYMVTITRLAEIIKESMWLFWKFVRADKEDGNLILRVSQQTRTDTKDPTISDLVKDIRAHLHKVCLFHQRFHIYIILNTFFLCIQMCI